MARTHAGALLVTAALIFGGIPAAYSQQWQLTDGAARDVGVGANGTVWVIGTSAVPGGYAIYKRANNAWVNVPGGAERIAACWAENRKVTQIAFKPDWNRHAKAAPFRRNDQLLSVMPYGLIVFPGSGITENLADKARRLGIPVWRVTEGSA